MTDAITKAWIKNASDEKAVANGCRFDLERAEHACNWIEDHLCLYEGDFAGQPFQLQSWQRDATMRMFGWVRYSEKWGREVRRFTKASIWIPKKNGKSPTLAAWGLYLLIGDGEPGQKFYFGAKDGNQAKIAAKHAFEMVSMSPLLRRECRLNRTMTSVEHIPSKSLMMPLSSDDSRSQRSKEGLNGSMGVDEVHVVDDAFMGITSRAGISRSEPLQIEVSTTGDNPEGYGFRQDEYGRRVERGEADDDQFLYIFYGVPQDITDEELDADILAYGKIANPMWGITIDPQEFMADYQRSRASITEFGRFKMYRLNKWQKAANPWIKPESWRRCKRSYEADAFRGRTTWCGLDLSLTRDMTAAVLVANGDEPGSLMCLPRFWMPRKTAEQYNDEARFLDWADKGLIKLSAGDTMSYPALLADLVALAEEFGIAEWVYDPTFATYLIQMLEQETSAVPVQFGQSMKNFAGPTEEVERLILDGLMLHPGHPVLDWQMGHVAVEPDRNGRIRPVKPSKDSVKKVDGVVALVMGAARALQEGGVSIYETKGLTVL